MTNAVRRIASSRKRMMNAACSGASGRRMITHAACRVAHGQRTMTIVVCGVVSSPMMVTIGAFRVVSDERSSRRRFIYGAHSKVVIPWSNYCVASCKLTRAAAAGSVAHGEMTTTIEAK